MPRVGSCRLGPVWYWGGTDVLPYPGPAPKHGKPQRRVQVTAPGNRLPRPCLSMSRWGGPRGWAFEAEAVVRVRERVRRVRRVRMRVWVRIVGRGRRASGAAASQVSKVAPTTQNDVVSTSALPLALHHRERCLDMEERTNWRSHAGLVGIR